MNPSTGPGVPHAMRPSQPAQPAYFAPNAELEARAQQAHAEAMHAVQSLVAAAQGRASRLLIEEVQHTDWGREIAGFAAALVLPSTSGADGAIADDATVQHTLLVALDAHGQRVFTLHGRGWNGRSLLPAMLQWARYAGAPVAWTRMGRALVVCDGRFALASAPPDRPLAETLRALSSVGWRVEPQGQGFVATRAVSNRDWFVMILVGGLSVALFPLTALLLAWMTVERVRTGEWPGDRRAVLPWKKADDRVTIECVPAGLRVTQHTDGAVVFERALDETTLQSLWVESGGATARDGLTLIEADRCTVVPLQLRGEFSRPNDPHAQDAAHLARAIVSVWSQGATVQPRGP